FRGLLDGRLVERQGVEDVLTLVPDGYVEGEALLDGVVALGGAGDRLGEVFPLALGEEAHMPEVDAHEGRSGAVEAFGRAQDGPVAAEDDDEFAGVLPLPQFGGVDDGAVAQDARLTRHRGLAGADADDLVVEDDGGDSIVEEGPEHTDGGHGRLFTLGVQQHHDVSGHDSPLIISSRRAGMSASLSLSDSRGVRPGRTRRKYSLFPLGPGSGEAAMSITRAACSATDAITDSSARRRLATVVTTPCLSRAERASSNWGSTIDRKSVV